MNTKKINRFKKIFPWYQGLSGDLLFWIAIDTLFLQLAKGFSLEEIVSITSISHVIGIALQIPIMKIVDKLGNTRSLKAGVILALLSALSFTFGKSFVVMVLATVLREMSASFKSISHIVLRHNLELVGEQDRFVDHSTSANTVYAVITMLISLVASSLFNINHYIPMIACISICILSVILSFFMVDLSEETRAVEKKAKSSHKVKFTKIIVLATISFGIFFAIVMSGQTDAKLFIQDELLSEFSEETTAIVIGLIIFVSRVVRIFANIIFRKVYRVAADKVGVIFAVLLMLCFAFLISAYFIEGLPVIKYSLMALGYLIILFSRDPFNLYINDLVLRNSLPEEQPRIMMILQFSKKLLSALMSVAFALIILIRPMVFIIFLYACIALAEVGISIYLYYTIKKKRLSNV